MQKGTLTRDQAIAQVGIEAVTAVEAENCQPTNLVGYNGAIQGDALIEWSARAAAVDENGTECHVIAYYYTTQQEIDDAGDDLSNVDWEIAGYEVV